MSQTLTESISAVQVTPNKDLLLATFRFMLQGRLLDDKFGALYRAGKIHGGVFLGRGQEALSTAGSIHLRKTDIFAPLIRDTAGRLAFGEPLLDSIRTYLGSVHGPMRGRDGNIHRGRPREGLLAMISHLGAMISVVNGMLMARRMNNIHDTVGLASSGEGATSTGSFHEAINQAAVEKLPLVLVVANNQYAYSTPNDRQFACADLVDKAVGYGVEPHRVDGTDYAACLKTMSHAIGRARAGHGPQLVVATLLRLCGHGEHDVAGYVDEKLKCSPLGRDCLSVAEDHLVQNQLADRSQIALWRSEIQREIEDVVAQVQREPAPDPFNETWRAISSPQLTETHE